MRTRLLREALLDTTERLMGTRKLSQLTMEEIAREAEIDRLEAIHAFPDKKALMMGLIERYEAKLFALRDRYLDEYPDGPRRRLKAALMALAEHHPRNGEFTLPNLLAILAEEDQWRRIADIRLRLYRETCEDEDPDLVAKAMKSFDDILMASTFAQDAHAGSIFKRAFGDLLDSLERGADGDGRPDSRALRQIPAAN